MAQPIDRAGLLLLVGAVGGPLLVGSLDGGLLQSAPPAGQSPSAYSELGGGGVPQTPGASTVPKLDVLLLTTPKVKSEAKSDTGQDSTADFDVTLHLGRNWALGAENVYVVAEWLSPSGKAAFPVTWTYPSGEASIPVAAGEFKIVKGRVTALSAELGSGTLRTYVCANMVKAPQSSLATANPPCGAANTALDLSVESKPTPKNVALLWIPAGFAAGCLVIATLVVLFHDRWNVQPLSEGRLGWEVGNSWAANLNAGAAIMNSLGALGLTAGNFGAIATQKEYAAWVALYALCAALAPLIFSLLKRVKQSTVAAAAGAGAAGNTGSANLRDGVAQRKLEETGTLAGFYLANLVNLLGVGGQLLLSYHAFKNPGVARHYSTGCGRCPRAASLLLGVGHVMVRDPAFSPAVRTASGNGNWIIGVGWRGSRAAYADALKKVFAAPVTGAHKQDRSTSPPACRYEAMWNDVGKSAFPSKNTSG